MQSPRKPAGFVLIELVLLFAIIAGLIVVLLPAINQTRRQARIAVCTSNMAQHAQGMANFASANDQSLPNAPRSPGGDLADTYGPRGMPAFRFATTDRTTNGFAFEGQGIRTMGHPTSPPTLLTYADRWMNRNQCISQLYWVILSEYMVDGIGLNTMRFDVFLSPADTQSRTEWDVFIDWMATTRRTALPALPEPAGFIAPIAEGGLQLLAPQGISSSSYHYPSSMVCNPEIWLRNPRNNNPVNPALYQQWGRFDAAGQPVPTVENYTSVVRNNRISDVAFPSNKVAFFLDRPVHNPNADNYFQPRVTISLAAADGSARATEPARSALPSRSQENSGPVLQLAPAPGGQPGLSPFASDLPGATDIPFIATWGGIRGRDLK